MNACCSIDTMDKWDQQKLEEVIEKKHGLKEKSMPKTEIVSQCCFHHLYPNYIVSSLYSF